MTNYTKKEAIILLAICQASQKGGARIKEIIQNCDFINHSQYSENEVRVSIEALVKGDFIIKDNDCYKASGKTLEAYKRDDNSEYSIYDDLENLEKIFK